jgi:biotin/methionine sulfoxide reductase
MAKRFQTASHWGAYYVHVDDERITRVEPFQGDPDPNALIHAVAEMVHSPLRIDRPYVRLGYLKERGRSRVARGSDSFVPVSWDTALDLVEQGLRTVREEHGNEAIYGGSYGWASAGRLHHAPSVLKRFLGLFGGYVDKRGNHSFGAAMHIAPYVIGRDDITSLVMPWEAIIGNTELVVMFGGMHVKNMQIDAGGAVMHENREWIRQAASRKIRFINISPAQTDVSDELKPHWIPIVPNTDTALMLGLAHTLVSEGLYATDFVRKHCVGFDAFSDYLAGYSDGVVKDANWASRICGASADDIRQLARAMASNRALVTVSWSVQRAHHGEQPVWAALALASLLGQIGMDGCGFSLGFGAVNGNTSRRPPGIPRPTLPLGRNPVKTFVPIGCVTDMLLNPGRTVDYDGMRLTLPDIKLIYSAGGNPFHHNSNLNRFVQAWRQPELVVVHEPWLSPPVRYADIVLPATTTLERNDILAADLQRHYVAMHRALKPVGQSRNDFDVFSELADRFGFGAAYTGRRDEMQWLRFMYDQARSRAQKQGYEPPEFDVFWEAGAYEFPAEPDQLEPLMFSAFRQDPDQCPLATPSGKIELYSERIAQYGYSDCPPHPTWIEPDEWLGSTADGRFPLHLLSHQPAARLHSQLDASTVSRASKKNEREALSMHPDDALIRGLQEGDAVRVFNDRGAFVAAVHITPQLMPRVVQIATGAWFDPVDRCTPSLEKHGNPNVVTSDRSTSCLAQASASQTVLVQVERCTSPPPVTAFDLPLITDPDQVGGVLQP